MVIEFGEANHVAAAAAAVAVEQILVGVNQKAGLVVGVQRTQPQEAAEADGPGLLPRLAEYGRPRRDPRRRWWVSAKSAPRQFQPSPSTTR